MAVKFDPAGLRAALNTVEMAHAVEELANEIATKVKDQHILVGPFKGQQGTTVSPETGDPQIDIPVRVETDHGRDRVRAKVLLAHPAGIAAQAKYGALTKAASEVGLNVRGH